MQNKKVSSPKVFVIILNYNGIETLEECLNSVFKSNYNNFEVVVVDNDSKDGSFEIAKQNFARAYFIKNSANVGFAQGNNVGIRFALEKFADMIFLLNNDAVVKPTTLTTLVKEAVKYPDAGILSPLILDGNLNIWFAGGKIDWKKMRTLHIQDKSKDLPYESEYLSGCAIIIKKEVFKKIGLFDERYFLYYEDADFSLRARKNGYKLLITPQAQAVHYEKSSSNNNHKIYWLVLSGLIFFLSHANLKQKIWIVPYLCGRKIKNLYSLHIKKEKIAREIRKAYKDFTIARKSY